MLRQFVLQHRCISVSYTHLDVYKRQRKNWFFGVLGIVFLADLVDTFIKGETYLVNVQTEYYYRCGIHVLLCIAAMFTKNVKFHTALPVSYTHLDVYKRQQKRIIQNLKNSLG